MDANQERGFRRALKYAQARGDEAQAAQLRSILGERVETRGGGTADRAAKKPAAVKKPKDKQDA